MCLFSSRIIMHNYACTCMYVVVTLKLHFIIKIYTHLYHWPNNVQRYMQTEVYANSIDEPSLTILNL